VSILAAIMKLDQWLSENPGKAKGFHGRISVTKQALARYRNEERIPNHDPMIAIFRETGGEVQPNDFYKLPKLRGRSAPVSP
jgi:hypothetical protein